MDINQYIEAGLTHSIHTSERRSFRGCRRRWDWISRQFYYPRVTARPLEFGVAFHAAMEAAYENRLGLWDDPSPKSTLAVALATFRRVVREQRAKYIELNGGIDDTIDADYKDRVVVGEGMLKYYFGKLYPEIDVLEDGTRIRPVKVEIKFEVPIPGDLWCKCDHCYRTWMKHPTTAETIKECERIKGRECDTRDHFGGLPVTLGGRLDILWEDEYGRYWIGD